jgi:methylenetetrahydrofolate dehydrogenase (NADP+)/methenyltetrahydrofolate cyclohydrolase
MSITHILDGKALGQSWLRATHGVVNKQARPPRLVIVQVGHNRASTVYVEKKIQAAASVGMKAEKFALPEDVSEEALLAQIHVLAIEDATDAILVQTPLPTHIDTQRILDAVPWRKDVDGLSAESIKRRVGGLPCHTPATPTAVLRVLIEEWNHTLRGLKVAVIGNGRVVGAPLRQMLLQAGAELVVIDRDTPQPQALTRTADVVVAACGVPYLLKGNWLKPGADVVDVGLTGVEEHGRAKLRGDVDPMAIEGIAARRTPAPGGIGPLTVAQLLANVAAAMQLKSL